jgi:hypothetical protein
MMVNSLDIASLNQFGIDRNSPLEARRKAGFLFSRAKTRGAWCTLWHKLQGKENRLKDLTQVAGNAKRRPAAQSGIANVALSRIIGSEGRTDDFDSAFNPLKNHNRDRWIGIASARRRGIALPPVELIQVDDEYFVRDGNHRVSVAKAAGQVDIEAQILYVLS